MSSFLTKHMFSTLQVGCNESRFGTERPTQQHVNKHIRDVHGLLVTPVNILYYRRRQNEAYQRRCKLVEGERSRDVKEIRSQFEAFASDPSQPLPTETLDEDVERRFAELMEVESDSEEVPTKERRRGARSKACNEWFGSGPDYDMSFRTTQYRDYVTEEEREACMLANLEKRQDQEEGPVDEKMDRR